MLYAFQDRENLFLIMDLMTGGDLRYHIGRQRRFSEEQTSNIHSLTIFPSLIYGISPFSNYLKFSLSLSFSSLDRFLFLFLCPFSSDLFFITFFF